MSNKWKVWLPVFFGLAIALGILIGNFIAGKSISENENDRSGLFSKGSKIQMILDLIDAEYVEEVPLDSISETIIPKILEALDPHSVYIPAKDLALMGEDLEGSFSGIGVQFNIQQDTVMVISVISGGPSEKLGIRAGDRIISVDDSLFVGKKISNESVMRKLRGEKGSKVKLGIKRNSAAKTLSFTVTRGDVPVKSVDVAYIIEPSIGYIKISSFGAQTYNEFITAIAKVNNQGAKKYIIDLRGNPGGYMDAAINMVNEFLEKGQLIVYTEGKAYPRKDATADGNGACQNKELVVLIDEWSASASEIFAGAMQDNDRAVVIGRRSFGKGLVQQQIPFNDGSAVRLTVAKYFTPSGRCIQKPYVKGDAESYEKDILNRYMHGEFSSKDSIDNTKTIKYKTAHGRVVYDGGGIMSDIFIPRDTNNYTPYYNHVANEGWIYDFAFHFTDANRAKLIKYKDWNKLLSYLQQQPILMDFVEYVETQKGYGRNIKQIVKSGPLIEQMIYSFIARNAIGDEAFYPILNTDDHCIEAAIKQLNKKTLILPTGN